MNANPIQEETFAGHGGVPIFFRTLWPAAGPVRGVIVLAHGLGEHGGRYGHLFDRLLPEGYGFYALDHRGFGRSGGKPGYVDRFEDYLKDLGTLIRMAKATHADLPLVLYGHSMGGLISLAYAMEHSHDIDFLITASPPIGTPNPPGGRVLFLAIGILSGFFPRFTIDSRGDPKNVIRDPKEVARKKNDPLCHTRISLKWISEFLAARQRVIESPLKIAVPALLMLMGTDDRVVLPEAARSYFHELRVRDKTFLDYPGYYHELHNDMGREIPLNDVADWLNSRITCQGSSPV
jgi:acylglycerol lipase